MFLLLGHSAPDIDAGQEDENKGLNNGREDRHSHKGERKNKGDDGSDDNDEQFFGKDVAEESQR